jgi:hypothetical protein
MAPAETGWTTGMVACFRSQPPKRGRPDGPGHGVERTAQTAVLFSETCLCRYSMFVAQAPPFRVWQNALRVPAAPCLTNGRFCYIRYRDEIIRYHLGFFAWTESAHQHDSLPQHHHPGGNGGGCWGVAAGTRSGTV